MSRIGRSRKNVRAHFFRNLISKKNESQEILWDTYLQISQVRIARMTNQIFNKILDLEREKGKEGPRKVRKFR